MKCNFCGREILNKGSSIAHQMVCDANPDRVKFEHSPNAGAQKGSVGLE